MKIIMLEKKPIARNEVIDNYLILDEFVKENFQYLMSCAKREGSGWGYYESDDYAPERARIWENEKQTRLHEYVGIKYINGVKSGHLDSLTDEDLQIFVRQIQALIDSATVPIKSQIRIEIV